MNEEIKETKRTKLLSDIILNFLLIEGFVLMVNSIIWMFKSTDDHWFTRMSMSLICFGFAGIILKLKK